MTKNVNAAIVITKPKVDNTVGISAKNIIPNIIAAEGSAPAVSIEANEASTLDKAEV